MDKTDQPERTAPEVITSDFADAPHQILLGALGLLFLAFALFPLREPDALLGLAMGRDVLREGVGAGGTDWFHSLSLALVHRGNGSAGVVVLRAVGLLLYGILSFGFLLARRIPPVPSAAVMGFTLLAAAPVFSAGPILSGMVFTGGLFFILVRGPGRGVLGTLPILFLLWANVAGSTALPGLAAATVYAAGLAITTAIPGGEEGVDAATLLRLAGGVAVSAVLLLAQPGTTTIYAVRRAGESPWLWLPLPLFLFAAALLPGARRRVPHLLTAGALSAGALLLGGVWTGALASAFPFLLAPFLSPSARRIPAGRWVLAGTTLALLIAAALLALPPGRACGFAMDPRGYPVEAVRVVRSRPLEGPVGASPSWYGYVAFRLSGTVETVADPKAARCWIGPPGGAPRIPSTWSVVYQDESSRVWVRD